MKSTRSRRARRSVSFTCPLILGTIWAFFVLEKECIEAWIPSTTINTRHDILPIASRTRLFAEGTASKGKKPRKTTSKKSTPIAKEAPAQPRPQPQQSQPVAVQHQRITPSEEERPYYAHPRKIDEDLLGDLTGGRPGAIIETEEQLAIKKQILQEMEEKARKYPKWINDYGESIEDEEAEYDIGDDPTAIDAATLGTWTIQDIRSRFEYEWDPLSDDNIPDPNIVELNQPGVRYVEETIKDEDGVEVGYDPVFGPSSPMDKRTILGTKDSFMIDDRTRDDSMLQPQFEDGDPEIDFNQDVVQFRKSLDIIETYVDPFLPDDMEIPRHVAKWHGYPERTHFEAKEYTNNRFTDLDKRTDFDSMTPWQARRRAIELARSQNAEWLPEGVSQQYHTDQRQIYEDYGTLVGTQRKGDIDPDILDLIRPALNVLGSCVELLSTHTNESDEDGNGGGTILRFAYHGLMKNKHGMKAWAETMLTDCGLDVTGVVFETGFRKRDPPYDGGDLWNGPRT